MVYISQKLIWVFNCEIWKESKKNRKLDFSYPFFELANMLMLIFN